MDILDLLTKKTSKMDPHQKAGATRGDIESAVSPAAPGTPPEREEKLKRRFLLNVARSKKSTFGPGGMHTTVQ